jgi:hypothetical protein
MASKGIRLDPWDYLCWKYVLGEDILSKEFKAQKVEAGLKVILYNKFISL